MARIVPDAELYGLPVHAPCPFCNGSETELHSPFGPQLSVATYWCLRCYAPFEYVKWSAKSVNDESV